MAATLIPELKVACDAGRWVCCGWRLVVWGYSVAANEAVAPYLDLSCLWVVIDWHEEAS